MSQKEKAILNTKTKDYFHIFTFHQQNGKIIVTHKQEQPLYTYTISIPYKERIQFSKVYIIREDDVDLSYYIMLLPNEY